MADIARARERVAAADRVAQECANSLPDKSQINGLDRWEAQVRCLMSRFGKK